MKLSLIPFTISSSSLTQSKQNNINDTSLHPTNFTEIVTIIKSLPLIANDQLAACRTINSLKSKLFNLTGELISITQALSLSSSSESSSLFDCEIKIRNKEAIVFTVIFNKISSALSEEINKLPKNSILYILNVKSHIVFDNNSSANIKFIKTANTRIFYKTLSINDSENILNFPFDISKLYKAHAALIKEKRMAELNRINSINTGKVIVTKSEPIISKVQSNPIVSSQLAKKKLKIEDIIFDDVKLLSQIKKATKEERNIEKFLSKKTKRMIYDVKNIDESIKIENNTAERIDIIGIITNVKIEKNVTKVEITSLNDSNKIQLIHYPNAWDFYPKIMQIISIKNIVWKMNRNFDFIIENPLKKNIEIVGALNEKQFQFAKELRFNSNQTYSSLISLVQSKIVRTIQKYVLTIKDISKITGRFEKEDGEEKVFRLFTKCIVDDGSFEAELNLYDDLCAKSFGYDDKAIKALKEMTEKANNGILYQKKDQTDHLNQNFEDIYNKQYIVYAFPFSKISNKHYSVKETKYFMNLGEKNHLIKNKAMNNAFINGDIYYEKDLANREVTLVPKPLLKAVYLEEIIY